MPLSGLCRLCGTKDRFLRDVLDENNKNTLKLIQELVQLTINDGDTLPTKICLSCEERLVSFQLFLLECYKVQETLRKLYLDSCCTIKIKQELSVPVADDDLQAIIKSELTIKDELTAEEIVNAIHDGSISELDRDDYQHDHNNVDSDDDNIVIATFKKSNKRKKTQESQKETLQLPEIISQSNNLKVKDFVKLECKICNIERKTWNALREHCFNSHKKKPVVSCRCGYKIGSKSVLYKHITQHKLKMKIKQSEISGNSENEHESFAYSDYNLQDFVSFQCTSCEKVCKSWYDLKSHCERQHKLLPVVRCVCGVSLKSKSVMYKHVKEHKSPSAFSCDVCPRITKTFEALEKHRLRHVPKEERRFMCSACDKIFNTKEALKSHEKSHIPIDERKTHSCDFCDMKFTTRSAAAAHKKIVHEKVKGYVCDLCGYACGTSGELRQHRAIHSDDKPFVCNKCFKSFKTYSNLKTHIDTHEGTSYACHLCNRVLNSRRTLRKHLLVHEDKCCHVCSYCNKAFKRRQTLKVHMHTHTGDRPLTCKYCDSRFAYASTLRSHRMRCHPDKVAAHTNYSSYQHVPHAAMPQDYIKHDLAAMDVGAAKNGVEAL